MKGGSDAQIALPHGSGGALHPRRHGRAVAKNDGPVKLNVLFIGAHPDDEAFTIPAFGQWAEDHGLSTGVVTITRGEGGGNAVGPEEGPALGILREGEERRAVGKAGIDNIFYLDTVDFYYTVSAPLTEQIWGHDTTLERVVRLVRETKPDVIVTMDPSPSPGNHGNHQYAARLATEAFYAAADPSRFEDQLKDEHLDTWDVKRLFRGGASGSGPSGSDCASTFVEERADRRRVRRVDGHPVGGERRPAVVAHPVGRRARVPLAGLRRVPVAAGPAVHHPVQHVHADREPRAVRRDEHRHDRDVPGRLDPGAGRPAARDGALAHERPLRRRRRDAVPRHGARPRREERPVEGHGHAVAPGRLDRDRRRRAEGP